MRILVTFPQRLGSVGRASLLSLGVGAIASVLTISGSIPGEANAASGTPSIAVSPGSGGVGTQLTLSGQNFPRRTAGTISWDGATGDMPAFTVNPNGTFSLNVPVPSVAPATYTLTAAAGTASASTQFQVTGTSTAATATATATSSGLATATPSPTATATAVIGSGASPSGQAMPAGDITGWHQIFADDFATNVPIGSFPGSVYGNTWSVYPDGWKDTTGNGTYMPSQVLSVVNGVLDYYVHTTNGVHLVAAPLPKVPGTDTWGAQYGAGTSVQGRTYGRYSVRYRSDSLHGYKTAWLLWPDSEKWPADGEIDFPEGDLDGTIAAFAHYASSSGGQDAFATSATYGSWHTSTTEWLPGKINFYLDGNLIGTSATDVPTQPMHWVLQTETSTDGEVPANSTAGHVQIDWVVAYAPE